MTNAATNAPPIDMADMPVQLPATPNSEAEARARFFNSGNAFNVKLPRVPATRFTAEVEAALASGETGFFACDQSAAIGAPFAATTPLMLARYAAIAPRATLNADFVATGAIWYVIRGSGTAVIGNETVAFGPGDVFLAPGGVPTALTAQDGGAVLWVVTAAQNATTSGIALIFSSDRQEKARNILPTLTLSLNTVPAGEQQRAHRHNSAAITLILKGENCHSMVGGEKCDWSPFATLVTPATEPHSHHNDSAERAMFLIVQDGGLHYHARTMGFTFLD